MPQAIIKRAKVLIVDDEPSNVRLLERVLELHGAGEVRSTTDSRKVLTMFLEMEPDLVLLDLNMPYMDGYAVMAQLEAVSTPENPVPILVLTADVTAQTKRRALSGGAKDFLTKPLDNNEVVLRIKNLLENRFLNLEMQRQVRERTSELEAALGKLETTREQVVKQERLRALGLMAGGIAHDFNNALTMILGYGELLYPWLKEHGGPREIGYLDNMIHAAQDATQVVSRLREFYRPAENNEIRVAVSLSDVAEQAVALTAPKWKAKSRAEGIQIRVHTELQSVPTIAGNGAELREVMTNLIFNAVDAMPQGGNITVRTLSTEAGVVVSVEDSGIGMTADERARCLEPFFTTKGDGGTGLGLSVVYGIVQRHGGTIQIASEHGRGATFSICFPESTVGEAVGPLAVPALERALDILVIDDQEIICELIAEHLKADGHTVTTAVDASEALAVFQAGHFDLVITDQSMPGMNGLQLAQAMKEIVPGIPVIVVSGFGADVSTLSDQPMCANLLLGKPVSAADLRRAIFQVMEQCENFAAA